MLLLLELEPGRPSLSEKSNKFRFDTVVVVDWLILVFDVFDEILVEVVFDVLVFEFVVAEVAVDDLVLLLFFPLEPDNFPKGIRNPITFNASHNIPSLTCLSKILFWFKLGEMLTSINQGFAFLSKNTSIPRICRHS